MRKIFLYPLLLLVVVCCSRDEPAAELERAGIRVNLTLNGSLCASTKAIVDDTYPITEELLSVTVTCGREVVGAWESLPQMPEILYLPHGHYVLTVQTNGSRAAVNEVPFYYGQTPFSITHDVVSSIDALAVLQSMAVSVSFTGDIAPLTAYKMSYFNIAKPETTLFTVTQAQNEPTPKRVYIDTPFAYGVKIEGRLNGSKWVKNIIQYNNLAPQTYHNILVN